MSASMRCSRRVIRYSSRRRPIAPAAQDAHGLLHLGLRIEREVVAVDARDEPDEDEETEDDDLLFRETENVWGYVSPGDDPYA